jgi:hypothetical protein
MHPTPFIKGFPKKIGWVLNDQKVERGRIKAKI